MCWQKGCLKVELCPSDTTQLDMARCETAASFTSPKLLGGNSLSFCIILRSCARSLGHLNITGVQQRGCRGGGLVSGAKGRGDTVQKQREGNSLRFLVGS